METARTQSPKSYLYTTLATTHLGEIASCIISILISNGRLTAKEISNRTKIPFKNIKSALVSLIQLNCIYYWQEDKNGKFYYSLKETGLLLFVYSGDIINHIKRQYGDEEAEIIQNILIHGHVKIEDYLNQFNQQDDKSKSNSMKINQENKFLKLFNDNWLIKLQDFHFHSLDDIWNKIFQECLKETPRSSVTSEIKRVAEAQAKAKVKLNTLLESGTTGGGDIFTEVNGMKKLKPDLVVTFNLSRFQKHLRTNAFVNMVRSKIGVLTAIVYDAALRYIENKSPPMDYPLLDIPGLINDPKDVKEYILSIENKLVNEKKITFSARDIQRLLPKDIDFKNSVITPTFAKPKRPLENGSSPTLKKIKLEDGIASSTSTSTSTSSSTSSNGTSIDLNTLEQHLKLLLNGTNTAFVNEISPGNYTIPFSHLTNILKQNNFEALVKATLGDYAFRILRCVKSMKLCDEKSICNGALLKEKTVRSELYHLIKANIIEIQEVPRSADRAASKTFYLFRHKSNSNFNYLKNCLIYDMAEILNRIQDFKLEHKILLEKYKLVEGQEDQYLLDRELKLLNDLQLREIKNLVKFQRIKSLYSLYNLVD